MPPLQHTSLKQQQGSVLLIGMIFLVVLMIGATSIMNSAVQDERITGNTKAKANTFMAAEAGLAFAKDHIESNSSSFTCGDYSDPAFAPLQRLDGTGQITNIGFGQIINGINSTKFSIHVYCNGNDIHIRSVGAMSNDNVKSTLVAKFQDNASPGGPESILNLPDGANSFSPPSSKNFQVNGNGNTAVSTDTDDNADFILDAIAGKGGQDKTDNFHDGEGNGGSVAAAEFPSPWGTASDMESFIGMIEKSGSSQVVTYPGGTKISGNESLGDSTEPTDMQVTIIDGDAEISGTVAGNGLLIVKGEITFKGTPDWNGVIIGLGGSFTISGGGGGGNNTNGSIYVANIDQSSLGWEFNNNKGENIGSNVDISGGGKGALNYNCQNVYNVWSMLDSITSNETGSLWKAPSCDGSSGSGTGESLTLSDWYEE